MRLKDPELIALQERIKTILPRILGPSPAQPVGVILQTGTAEGSVNVRFSLEGGSHEPGAQLVLSEQVAILKKLPDLALADFLARGVKRVLTPEE